MELAGLLCNLTTTPEHNMRRDFFQVLDQADRSMGYFKATTASQAKMAVTAGLTVKKLSGEEIYEVYQNGYGVSNVVDGRVFLGELEPEVDPNQQDLPIPAPIQE